MLKKLLIALAIPVLALACASLTPKDVAGQAIVTAEAALHIVTDAELALRCDQPTSIPGHCIDAVHHATYKQKLLDAFTILGQAQGIYSSLPSTGTPSIIQITNLIAQIGAIIQEIKDGFPDAGSQANLLAQPAVAKTIAVKASPAAPVVK